MTGILRDRSRSVVVFAAQSRIFVFILQIFFNYLIPDHNADVFNPESSKNVTVLDKVASHLLDGLAARWDAIYFMHIAEYGYTYENSLVFFPLFPLLTKALAYSLLFPLHYFISHRNVLHLTALSINFIAFLFSAYFFYRLGCAVIKQEHVAYRAAQLFCVNPASVFFSAAYSESLFSVFTFAGLLKLQQGSYLKASTLFAFGSATRSNGIINAGFIIYSYMLHWHKKFCDGNTTSNKKHNSIVEGCIIVWEMFSMMFWTFISCSLLLSYQLYCYLMYCNEMKNDFKNIIPNHLVKYGELRGYKMPGFGSPPTWCHNELPFSYSQIQEQHWNVGVFRYYEVNQLPNFLLALPLLVISISLCLSYFSHKPMFCVMLGMVPKTLRKKINTKKVLQDTMDDYPMFFFYQDSCYVFVVQLAVLTTFGTICMHIQVITRMVCSACPAFYWYISERCMTKEERIALTICSQNHHEDLLEKDYRLFADENIKGYSGLIDRNEHSCDSGVVINGSGEIEIIQRFNSMPRTNKAESTTNSKNRSIEINRMPVIDNNLKSKGICEESVVMKVFKDSEVIDWNEGTFNRIVSIYFHLYLFVGIAAFSNFFPWT